MTFDKSLVKILACPDCRADISYQKQGTKETLKCKKCRRGFQIKSGIPIMLPRDN